MVASELSALIYVPAYAVDGFEEDCIAWFSAEEAVALSDHEVTAVSRNATLAALRGGIGLPEDSFSKAGRGLSGLPLEMGVTGTRVQYREQT